MFQAEYVGEGSYPPGAGRRASCSAGAFPADVSISAVDATGTCRDLAEHGYTVSICTSAVTDCENIAMPMSPGTIHEGSSMAIVVSLRPPAMPLNR